MASCHQGQSHLTCIGQQNRQEYLQHDHHLNWLTLVESAMMSLQEGAACSCQDSGTRCCTIECCTCNRRAGADGRGRVQAGNQLDGALEYLGKIGSDPMNRAELEEASGVGVEVTHEQLAAAVKAAIQDEAELLQEDRWADLLCWHA